MAEAPGPLERLLGSESGIEHVPAEINTEKVSIARIYDYSLGGKDNFAVDRAAAAAMMEVVPEAMLLAKANRYFLRQAVRYLVGEAGIRQIVDIGSGLPTVGNVHEIAQDIAPETRVVYVDNDPIVLAHSRALLASNDRTTFLNADLREPDAIFGHPDTVRLIDQSQPFAVLLGGILMHLEDEEDPEGVAADLRDRLPSGGFLMVSNTCDNGEPRAMELSRVFAESGMGSRCFRSWDEQIRYFDGLELVEPGLVPHNQWRAGPDIPEPDSPAHSMHIGGIGRKA
ncbi:S-adenosyl methyltransferase [Saccharopolyspora antimicrobica]|uniref:S-adenosyl methyltransferase n=1 Tax=Saccharopolyspora antimicrobica TaxID=455193 RepID=A0A1I4YIK5_9PSEU|nr:SAM-dependent methyltransferase [Saccharopolyspora antimicrobica]RKT82690.1 S-adenosyl methyltransferase [Saccharopolyspora antimicrobica]SFN37856.1 S-adenosyl methyltransferase [Saccharopolyspora antimicrobica]